MDGSPKSMAHSLWEVCSLLPLLWDTHTLPHVVIMTFYVRIWDSVSETVFVYSFPFPKSGAFGWLDSVSRILNCLLLPRTIGYQLVWLKCFQRKAGLFSPSPLFLLTPALVLLLLFYSFPGPPLTSAEVISLKSYQVIKNVSRHSKSLARQSRPFTFWLNPPAPSHLLLAPFLQYPHIPLSYSALFQLWLLSTGSCPGLCLMPAK